MEELRIEELISSRNQQEDKTAIKLPNVKTLIQQSRSKYPRREVTVLREAV